MTKQAFLDELKQALAGAVSPEDMMDSYRYYSSYIDEQMQNGKTEECVIEELGRPSLIARSIIAAKNGARVADEEYTEDGKTRRIKRNTFQRKQDYDRTIKEEKQFTFDFNAWYAKVLYVAVVVLLILLVFSIIKGLFWIFIRFGIPILLVLGIIYLIMYFVQ